jgi:hypothetical protein
METNESMKRISLVMMGIVGICVLLMIFFSSYLRNLVRPSHAIGNGDTTIKTPKQKMEIENNISQNIEPTGTVKSVVEEGYFSKEMEEKLLTSRENFFQVERMRADKFPSHFIDSHHTIWQIVRNPGILDLPDSSVGVRDNALTFLNTLPSAVSYYNAFLIPPKNEIEATALATELLRVVYYHDEFGYANNTSDGRGYVVVSSHADIVDPKKDAALVALNITPPTTIKKENNLMTNVWFFGRHNCELHHFTMTVDSSLTITAYHDEVIGEFGTCHRLFYE